MSKKVKIKKYANGVRKRVLQNFLSNKFHSLSQIKIILLFIKFFAEIIFFLLTQKVIEIGVFFLCKDSVRVSSEWPRMNEKLLKRTAADSVRCLQISPESGSVWRGWNRPGEQMVAVSSLNWNASKSLKRLIHGSFCSHASHRRPWGFHGDQSRSWPITWWKNSF